MGQWFLLVNLDKCERQQFAKFFESIYEFQIHYYLSGRSFTARTSDELMTHLRQTAEEWVKDFQHDYGPYGNCPVTTPAFQSRNAQAQCPLLAKLPIEIIQKCFFKMPTLRDKACFALTCQAAWDIGRYPILAQLNGLYSWERDRILILGDSTSIDDVPPDVLNEEELAILRDIKAGTWRRSRADLDDILDAGACSRRPLTAEDFDVKDDAEYLTAPVVKARGMSKYAEAPVDDVREWLIANGGASGRKSWFHFHSECTDLWSKLVRHTLNAVPERGMILCNLTTHEYVRGAAFISARKRAPETYTPIQSFYMADALLMRIIWSPPDSYDGPQGVNPRGVWAGHRFEFRRKEELPRGEDGLVLPPWKDVSDELVRELWHFSSEHQDE
ncbi:hypothetical protein AURDEDRAFT_127808 [Auricularia subglabra TFB-10046 SS5]|uniref:F-box domain-containing protein n=1 Tax=Auricularia subglabra (strain TFB-10046 / SS5) TaxID=717982 RepID=J0WWE4_AURST|nr:hypothetical protein AURDEDRAFT_127808 [Auricularia subglabra TFB-10046 SS5]